MNGIYMFVEDFKYGLAALLESEFSEVNNLFLWMLARFTCGNMDIGPSSTSTAIPDYVFLDILPQIRMFAHHENGRTRELARIILKNIDDNEFFATYDNMISWIKSINLGKQEGDTVTKLQKEQIELYLLLNPEVTLDQILIILKGIEIKPASCLTIIGKLAKVRSENEIARQGAIVLANSIKIIERDTAANSAKSNEENSEISINNKTATKPIFISYCWANKSLVKTMHDILSEKGFGCWIDDGSMKGGSQLFGEIDNGISACKVFISCCSNNYGASVNCKREVNLASERKKLIIPVLIATCDPWPPKGEMGPLLAGTIYIDLSSEEKFRKNIEQLIAAINQSL